MADYSRVVWQADVSRVVLVVLAARSGRLVADDEGALHVDAYIAGVQDGVVDVGLGRRAPRSRRHCGSWYIFSRCSSSTRGATGRGVRESAGLRHGCTGAWLQPRPLCSTTMKAAQTTPHSVRLRGKIGRGQKGGVERRRGERRRRPYCFHLPALSEDFLLGGNVMERSAHNTSWSRTGKEQHHRRGRRELW